MVLWSEGLTHFNGGMLGNFSCFSGQLSTFFFKKNFFKNFFQEHYQSVKQFGFRSGPKCAMKFTETLMYPDLTRNSSFWCEIGLKCLTVTYQT